MRRLSAEPVLGPINLRHLHLGDGLHLDALTGALAGLDRHLLLPPLKPPLNWVEAGGEPGPRARRLDPAWVRDQYLITTPFNSKQWDGHTSKSGGRVLDGRTWDEMPGQAWCPKFPPTPSPRRRSKPSTWLSVSEVGDVAWTREIAKLRNQKFKVQDQTLDEMVARYRPRKVAMDETGMGAKPVEDATGRYGRSIVEGVVFTSGRQLDLATAFRERLEDRKIRIPQGNRELRTDLHSVKKVAGPTGHPRLLVDDGEMAGGGHADSFWAAVLACGACAGGVMRYEYTPVRPRSLSEVEDDDPLRDEWAVYAPRGGDGLRGLHY